MSNNINQGEDDLKLVVNIYNELLPYKDWFLDCLYRFWCSYRMRDKQIFIANYTPVNLEDKNKKYTTVRIIIPNTKAWNKVPTYVEMFDFIKSISNNKNNGVIINNILSKEVNLESLFYIGNIEDYLPFTNDSLLVSEWKNKIEETKLKKQKLKNNYLKFLELEKDKEC